MLAIKEHRPGGSLVMDEDPNRAEFGDLDFHLGEQVVNYILRFVPVGGQNSVVIFLGELA